MNNPFLNLALGISNEAGQACVDGLHAEITCYAFAGDELSGPGNLLIARKDQFDSCEEAFVSMVLRIICIDDDKPVSAFENWEADDFIEIMGPRFLHVYGGTVIEELKTQKFTELYDKVLDCVTGFVTYIENDKKRFYYSNWGIFKDNEEYTGNYRRFDPLYCFKPGKCYTIFSEEDTRIEYLSVCDRYYIFLTWFSVNPYRM